MSVVFLQLEATLIAMSNQECAKWLSYNVTRDRTVRKNILQNFKNGIPPNILCTKGIYNEERKIFSVSILVSTLFSQTQQ